MRTGDREPTSARELRDLVTGWPEGVLGPAVEAALGFDPALAAMIAAWLIDCDVPEARWNDPPPLRPVHVAAICRELNRRLQ